jgi:hypothetical protein
MRVKMLSIAGAMMALSLLAGGAQAAAVSGATGAVSAEAAHSMKIVQEARCWRRCWWHHHHRHCRWWCGHRHHRHW